jgi:hypothetical protein
VAGQGQGVGQFSTRFLPCGGENPAQAGGVSREKLLGERSSWGTKLRTAVVRRQ